MNGLRQVNLDSLKKWQEHLPRVAQQLRAHPELTEMLEQLGYEQDANWTEMLEGIEPVDYPCRYPERKPWLKYLERELRVYFKSKRYLRERGL